MSEFAAYLRLGFDHITDRHGYDHILFVIALCAVYQLRDWRRVLLLVTAFTVGHSVTLALSTLRVVLVRADVVELLIPVTILATAVSNFFYHSPDSRLTQPAPASAYARYAFALGFGLIHGLGFSTYLKSLLGRSASVVSQLLAFNLGLELGQLLIVAGVLAVSFATMLRVKHREWNLIVSGTVAGMALSLIIKNWIF